MLAGSARNRGYVKELGKDSSEAWEPGAACWRKIGAVDSRIQGREGCDVEKLRLMCKRLTRGGK